jgi:hypothetical protein
MQASPKAKVQTSVVRITLSNKLQNDYLVERQQHEQTDAFNIYCFFVRDEIAFLGTRAVNASDSCARSKDGKGSKWIPMLIPKIIGS